MSDNRIILYQSMSSNEHLEMRRRATQTFKRIYFWAQWFAFLRKLCFRSVCLESLNENEIRRRNGRSLTTPQQIPIAQIQGSEGRSRDFDSQFRPLHKHLQDRWINLAIARARGIQFPPVDLVQIGDRYFVRDGHHRISVAKTEGQVEIDALVTIL